MVGGEGPYGIRQCHLQVPHYLSSLDATDAEKRSIKLYVHVRTILVTHKYAIGRLYICYNLVRPNSKAQSHAATRTFSLVSF